MSFVHFLFVGHFDGFGRHQHFKITKPLIEAEALPILLEICDLREDGTSSVATGWSETKERWAEFVALIDGEIVSFRRGYLELPWLSHRVNRKSVALARRLQAEAGLQVYEQGDGAYLTAEDLIAMESEERRKPRAKTPRRKERKSHAEARRRRG